MDRVLVDSSVWIDYLRSGKSKEAILLDQLLAEDNVCTTWIIRVELLSGARSEPEYNTLEQQLVGIPILEIANGFWNTMARTRFKLARSGFQASLPDLSIALMARQYDCHLLTSDRPLSHIAKLLRVKLIS